ncbi:hypothetical protein C8R44DRAFT_737807 [Mycena epipterygia]|nr:hypothetical protein C8R44DRAFT_737807 [Mycena epipterygia]
MHSRELDSGHGLHLHENLGGKFLRFQPGRLLQRSTAVVIDEVIIDNISDRGFRFPVRLVFHVNSKLGVDENPLLFDAIAKVEIHQKKTFQRRGFHLQLFLFNSSRSTRPWQLYLNVRDVCGKESKPIIIALLPSSQPYTYNTSQIIHVTFLKQRLLPKRPYLAPGKLLAPAACFIDSAPRWRT